MPPWNRPLDSKLQTRSSSIRSTCTERNQFVLDRRLLEPTIYLCDYKLRFPHDTRNISIRIMAKRLLAATPLLLLLLLSPAPSLALDNDFSFYPTGAQNCLKEAAKSSQCSGNDAQELNTCLCGNGGGFITKAAKCLGREDKDEVNQVYETMSKACSESTTPIGITQTEFVSAANSVSPTTSSTVSSTSSTSMPTKTGNGQNNKPTQTNSSDDGKGLSTSAIIGIGVAAGLLSAIAAGVMVFWCIRRKRRRDEESHPMLPDHRYNESTTYPPTDPSSHIRSNSNAKPNETAWGFTTPSPSNYNDKSPNSTMTGTRESSTDPRWGGSAQQGAYAPPPPDNVAELSTQGNGNSDSNRRSRPVFEMEGTPAITDTQGYAPNQQRW